MLASVFNNILAITHFPGIFDYLSTTTYSPPLEESGQGATGRESHNSVSLFCSLRPTGESTEPIPHSPIHTLNDDVLLNIFHLYRLDVQHEYTYDGLPDFYLRRQSWWYKLTQVCGRWRYLIFASPSQLRLHLLCTYGVSVAKMLAHSPPLPLTIYYDGENRETTEEDEEDILLALRHSDRVHYISLICHPRKCGRSSQLWTSDSQSSNAYISFLRPEAMEAWCFPEHFKHHFYATSICRALPFRSDLHYSQLLRVSSVSGFVISRHLPISPQLI
jgi:hypothetical protein